MYAARKIIHQAQSDSILFAHRASEQLADNAVDEAIQLCEQGVKQFPFYAEGHYVLARCYQEQQRIDEAQAEFERTLSFNPGHLKALKALAYLNYKKKMQAHGRSILEQMALYDPLNVELIGFLEEEDEDSLQTVSEPEAPAIPEEPLIEAEPAQKSEAEPLPAQEEILIEPEQAAQEEAIISFDVEEDFKEMPVTEEDFDLDLDAKEKAQSTEPIPDLPDREERAVQESEPFSDSDNLAMHDVVDELFADEAPAIDLDLGDDSPGLDLDDITDMTMISPGEKESFEQNIIGENLEETKSFEKPLDLDQFDNTEDDFSTLIEGYFQKSEEEVPVQEEGETIDKDELEQPVEERSFLDTSVIFREKRTEDQQEEQVLSSEQIEDMNKVADEIDNMNTKVTFAVEQQIEKSAELIGEERDDSILEATEPLEQHDDSLDKVIERIEKTKVPREKVSENFDSADAAALEDEQVSIEDILKNPTLLTPTFGEILIAQKKFEDARQVFKALAKGDPENDRFQKKIEFLDKIVAIKK